MSYIKLFLKGTWKDLLIASFLISFAAGLNASMDTIDHHFNRSIFKDMPEYFAKDWTRKYEKDFETGELLLDEDGNYIRKKWNFVLFKINIHPLFFDAWHLFKSAMVALIILFAITLIFSKEHVVFNWNKIEHWYALIILFIWFSLCWNFIFNMFYDHWLLL